MCDEPTVIAEDLIIHNKPFQDKGYEGYKHLAAKVCVAEVLSNAGYDVLYEQTIRSKDGKWPFHVDVFIPRLGIGIECDGKTHGSKKAKAKDKWKDAELKKVGIRIIRISVTDAVESPEYVLKFI